MRNLVLAITVIIEMTWAMPSDGQPTVRRSLDYYLSMAEKNNPTVLDFANQTAILNSEKQYQKNVYTHAQTLLTGSYLFVPIVVKDNGSTSFKWNAQSANDYYGYDLGVSNGNLQAGVTWTKPLLGNSVYKAAESQLNVQQDMLGNNIRLSRHDLERNVVDQYILCMLDKNQIDLADSVAKVLATQSAFITKLANAGQAKLSDLQLINIEKKSNEEMSASCRQSYHNHLMELNALCCIHDSSVVEIEKTILAIKPKDGQSLFLKKYDLDSLNAVAAERVYEMRYKPQLSLFTNVGMQTTQYDKMYKNFGMSAGLTFSMLLSDGKLNRIKRRQTEAALSSIAVYKNNLMTQNGIRVGQCLAAIRDYDSRLHLLDTQLKEYARLMDINQKEIQSGQISVFEYLTTWKNMITARQQMMAVEANRLLAINTYNYYNW
jgi:outer membrane protein TolC